MTPALILVMLGAYVTADRAAAGAIFSNPEEFTSSAPFLFIYAALVVFAFGPGRFSLDGWLRQKV